MADAGGVGRFEIREADISGFEDARTLHGDRTIYLRLKLPDLLPERRRLFISIPTWW